MDTSTTLGLLVVIGLASISGAAPLRAQADTRALPGPLTGQFGRTDLFVDPFDMPAKTQTWMRGDTVPRGLKIAELSTRRSMGSVAGPITAKFELVLENSTLTFAGMSQDQSKNLGKNATTVFSGKLSWPKLARSTDPNLPTLWTKLSKPFVYVGPHLLVQFTVSGASFSAGRLYSDGLDMTRTTHIHFSSGKSCGSGQLSAGYDGKNYLLALRGAAANSPLLYFFGNDKVRFGPTPLPLSLNGLGLRGCFLGVAPLVIAGSMTDKVGTHRLVLPFSLPTSTLSLSTQVLYTQATPSKNLATTNVMTSLLGNRGLLNMVYQGRLIRSGPFKANFGPVFLTR